MGWLRRGRCSCCCVLTPLGARSTGRARGSRSRRVHPAAGRARQGRARASPWPPSSPGGSTGGATRSPRGARWPRCSWRCRPRSSCSSPTSARALVLAAAGPVVLVVGGLPRRWVAARGAARGRRRGGRPGPRPLLSDYQRARLTSFARPRGRPAGRRLPGAAGAAGHRRREACGGRGSWTAPAPRAASCPSSSTTSSSRWRGRSSGSSARPGSSLLLGVLVVRVLVVAARAEDAVGRLVGVGVATWLAVQVVQNVGMNLGLLPVTGLPLPFVSYGGSSMLVSWLAVGLVDAAQGGAGRAVDGVARPVTEPFPSVPPGVTRFRRPRRRRRGRCTMLRVTPQIHTPADEPVDHAVLDHAGPERRPPLPRPGGRLRRPAGLPPRRGLRGRRRVGHGHLARARRRRPRARGRPHRARRRARGPRRHRLRHPLRVGARRPRRSCAPAAATTTIYPTTIADDVAFILADSGARVVFAEDAEQVEKLRGIRDRIPGVGRRRAHGRACPTPTTGSSPSTSCASSAASTSRATRGGRRAARRHPARPAGDDHLHLGHDRTAQGRAAAARHLDLRGGRHRGDRHPRPRTTCSTCGCRWPTSSARCCSPSRCRSGSRRRSTAGSTRSSTTSPSSGRPSWAPHRASSRRPTAASR